MNDQSAYTIKKYFLVLSSIFLLFIIISCYTGQYWFAIFPFGLLLAYYGLIRIDIVFLILVFTLPWSTEYNFNPNLGTDLPDEPLMLLTAVLCIVYLAWKPLDAKQALNHPLFLFLMLHCLWMGVTVLFSTEQLISLKYVLAKGWYIIAFVTTPFFIFREKGMFRKTAIVFAVSMLILTVIVLIRQYQLQFVFEKVNASVKPFFRNHVNYSAMLVCTVPVWMAIYQLNKKNKTLRMAVMILLLLLTAAVFVSYSRGAWLALVIGLGAYWLVRRKLLFISFIATIIIIIISVSWLKSGDRYLRFAPDYKKTIFHSDFRKHLAATYHLKDVSTAERFNRWIAGIRMIKDKPITGYGPNTFYSNYKAFTVPAFKTWVSKNEDHSTIHNYFLLILVEQGVPGLVLFLLLAGAMLYYAERLYHRISDPFYRVVAITTGSVVVMILVLNFLSDLIETDKVGSLFFLCLGVLIMTDLNTRRNVQC